MEAEYRNRESGMGSRNSVNGVSRESDYESRVTHHHVTQYHVTHQASAAAHGHHDLEAVAVRQPLGSVPAAWHDLAVSLERDALAREVEPRQQLGAVERCFELARFAVDGNGDHGRKARCAWCRTAIFTRCPALGNPETRDGRRGYGR